MLPEFIEPKQLAKEQRILSGEIPLQNFARAKDLLLPSSERLNFNWQFTEDEHGQVRAILAIKAKLILECQRCQQPFEYMLEAEIPMQLVHTELEAESLPLMVQPLYVDQEERTEAFPILEDELILNIPEFPKHEKKDCEFKQNQAYYDTPSNGDTGNTHKPFANLKLLSKEKK